ncbi:major histocompatibility complex class I-related gene protein-like [Brienomyrus brachyistius]|uniref:major histocompatibility complex class I-related gene protein-like n=1 Tax=Brienomyrus brachyistius TaxID=42636 RepID=UPI0020B44BB5|nr:major histocompatibility complex class I-related gene protein-like [Brienomyrus brachyistius]
MCYIIFKQPEIILCLTAAYFNCSSAEAVHSLHRHCVASQGTRFLKNIQFLMVDDITVYYYKSGSSEDPTVPAWLNHTEGLELWKQVSLNLNFNRHVMDTAVRLTAEHFNHSDDHTYQAHGHCELNPDGTSRSFMSHAYDGMDFVSFDVERKSWVAVVPQAIFYKQRRESDMFDLNRLIAHYQSGCINWLKKLLEYSISVRKTRVPEVKLFARNPPMTSAIEVTCHVTGFYPREVHVEWLGADELPLMEGVISGEVLPNGDLTYQLRKILRVPEDQGTQSYSCRVAHSSVPENITVIWAPETTRLYGIIPGVLLAVLVLMLFAVIFIFTDCAAGLRR